MKSFYYAKGEEQVGPFTLNELKEEGVTQNTLVWHEGLDDWKEARHIKELQELFELSPPPLEVQSAGPTAQDFTNSSSTAPPIYKKKSMFEEPFSFKGRIRRLEYGISFIIYMVIYVLALGLSEEFPFVLLIFIPAVWFFWAQGAKRCHDRGNSGWFQLIPFYVFVLLFVDGDYGKNQYGRNPKGL